MNSIPAAAATFAGFELTRGGSDLTGAVNCELISDLQSSYVRRPGSRKESGVIRELPPAS
jgi:hypothetical protein